jgi:F-type H+-transporting ATPase subunit a
MILAIECDPAVDIVCKPENVNELFEFKKALFSIGPVDITRTVVLMLLAAAIVVALLYFGLRKHRVIPTKFGVAIESLVNFVRNEIAIGIIGPQDGLRYFPYLLAIFLFILVGNLFEVTPLINFPITSRMAIPLFLALVTWVLFVGVGFARQGYKYLLHTVWPPGVPVFLKPLVGLIELVSIFLVRPFSLAVRLFANMVAGHVMLSLLIVSGWVFMTSVGDIGFRSTIGVAWFGLGLAIFMFEVIVAILQAYIFTLLSAVYIQTSVHPEH